MRNLLEDENIKELVAYRNIQPEDYSLLQKLTTYPQTALTSYWHNFFINAQDNSAQLLRWQIEELTERANDKATDEIRELIEMHEIFLELCQKYDWATANNINRVLERLE